MKSDRKLHVLHLPSWYIPEGGQFCRNQVQALNHKGIFTAILANVPISIHKYGKKTLYYFLKKSAFSYEDEINVLRHFQVSLAFLKKWNGVFWSWKVERMFRKYCKKFGKPDVIHAHSVLWGGFAAKYIKKNHDIPYVITEHRGIFGLSCEWAKDQFVSWQDNFMKEAFSAADLIIPVSEKLIPKIRTFLDKDVPIQVVSNVLDTDFFHYKNRRKTTDKTRAVMVNGFNYVKAYDIFFPAINRVLKQNKKLEVTIVGEDFFGENFEELLNNVEHKERIKFLGEIDESGVRDALWEADFFIISSRVESQSVSTLEALSTGLPIVCTEVVPEQIANESNSIRVPIEDVEALSEAILEMAEKYEKFDGKMISENVKKIADRKVVANQLIEIYRKVLS